MASWGIIAWSACPLTFRPTSDQVELGLREGGGTGDCPHFKVQLAKVQGKPEPKRRAGINQNDTNLRQMLEPSSWTIAWLKLGIFCVDTGWRSGYSSFGCLCPPVLSLITLGYWEAEP